MGFKQSFLIVSDLVKDFQLNEKFYLKQIVQFVYQLYGLTEEEIRIVEGE